MEPYLENDRPTEEEIEAFEEEERRFRAKASVLSFSPRLSFCV